MSKDINLSTNKMDWKEKIEELFRKKKINFSSEVESGGNLYLDFYLGSIPFIFLVEVENDGSPALLRLHFRGLDDEASNDEVFTKEVWYNKENPMVDIVGDCESMLEDAQEFYKPFVKAVSKIQTAIERIHEITEELGLDEEFFISVNYDFDF